MINLINDNQYNFCHVDLDEGIKIYEECFKKTKKQIYKYEARQYYDVTYEKAYYSLLKNDYQNMKNEIVDYWNSELKGVFKKIANREVEFTRLHAINYPITRYLEYEYYSYVASEKIGEKIKIIEKKYLTTTFREYYDFLIFDDFMLMVNDYDENGKFLGFWYTSNKDLINDMSYNYLINYSKASDFKSMFNADIKIINDIYNGIKI